MNRCPSCYHVQNTGGKQASRRVWEAPTVLAWAPPGASPRVLCPLLHTAVAVSTSSLLVWKMRGWDQKPPGLAQPELVPSSVSGETCTLRSSKKYPGNGYDVQPQNQHQTGACSASPRPQRLEHSRTRTLPRMFTASVHGPRPWINIGAGVNLPTGEKKLEFLSEPRACLVL